MEVFLTLRKALQARGVSDEVMKVADSFRCPVCGERKRVGTRRPATLETLPRKWERIQIDCGDWLHPYHDTKHRFVLMIDEGSRFRCGRVFPGPPARAGTWENLKTAYEQLWLPHHGTPHTVRVDPAGPWRSHNADQYFAERGVMLETIPAEAHWQLGVAEAAIKSVKAVMTEIANEFPEMSLDELFSRSLWVCNAKDLYRGFSPLQHASGRTPDEEMRLFETTEEKPIQAHLFHDGGFGQNIRAMCLAEQAFIQEQAKQRLRRAEQVGHRKLQVYQPGDLVFYWRHMENKKNLKHFPRGRFLGPARVIATETRKEEDGTLRPGSIIWLHRGGRLIRAAPEQLRHASPRERMVEELAGPVELPWAINRITKEDRQPYLDISEEVPEEQEWQEAHDVPPPPRAPELHRSERPGSRITGKRKPSDLPRQPGQEKGLRPQEKKGVKRENEGVDTLDENVGRPPPLRSTSHSVPYDEDALQAVEISIEVPQSRRGMKKFIENPVAYFVQKLKRKQVEVNERKLQPGEREQFDQAKATEVNKLCGLRVFSTLARARSQGG